MSSERSYKKSIVQSPEPGHRLLRFRGDILAFRLNVDPTWKGAGYLRTNLGQARTIRREIIRHVELNEAPLGRDWFDLPMQLVAPGVFETQIPLNEVGHFEAKCLFLPEGRREPVWPAGPNTAVNVEPADSVCGNIVYNAFVRQFGPHKDQADSDLSANAECVQQLDQGGFTVIPPSGTFRNLIAELDFIMGHLGCRLLQLLPIHPTPTTYARMGRFGSPYAALSFTAVDPALAVFDPKATPLEQFIELVDAVHARGGKIIIDIAINHTGWAAGLHETHPQWLARKADGEIENPGAWGVVWADLTRLDYRHKELWRYMANVFLTWCRRGVDGYRCDAGYMIPMPAWRYIIAKVRDQFPDTLFLLEGLGGKISVTRDLLNRANFNWGYSELFQNYDRSQIDGYLPGANEISASDGITVHFAETHDNNRLAATSKVHARMRTTLCALAAPHGAFGFANGVEWLATEKINVHEACTLNWGAEDNLVADIAHLSRLLKTHPAFGPGVDLALIPHGEGNFAALARRCRSDGAGVVVLANLDAGQAVDAAWRSRQAPFLKKPMVDLVSGGPMPVKMGKQSCHVSLQPGQVVCLTNDDDPWLADSGGGADMLPPALLGQRLRAKVLEVASVFGVTVPPDAAGADLLADAEGFCRGLNPSGNASRVVPWQYPEDTRREVMIPPGHFLLVSAAHAFRARIVAQDRILAVEESLADERGRAFILFAPLDIPEAHAACILAISLFEPDGTKHIKAPLLALSPGDKARVRTTFTRDDCHRLPLLALGTNGRGAMLRLHADGGLRSRYDAFLAANLNPDYPEDRWMMLARWQAWAVFQGHSQELNLDNLEQFGFDYQGGAWWRYQSVAGQGEHVVLQLHAQIAKHPANTVILKVERFVSQAGLNELADDQPIALILRPHIEDRNFHDCTKAYTGPETAWPAAVHAFEKGFRFSPAPERTLIMQVDSGRFSAAPEWYYMVHRPLEAQRGLDPDSDLFGPGYFTCQMQGGEQVLFTAQVLSTDPSAEAERIQWHQPLPGIDLDLPSA
ncbi:MAG: glycogen debranching protein, partial [Desulfatitalea sp.]|nr:glycogen debranching enzyme N-terminal domain-containing protein [Desulfatitalea sp.]NNK01353.1 glycogen debranching protein [Desulfatitalea sp.]